MQETCVEFVKGESTLSWYSSDSKWIARMVQLANDWPDEVKIICKDEDGLMVHCPASWFKPPKPPIKRDLTPEQRAELAERMKQARESR
nr:MAG TPA: periplasmic protein [Bacteriophage sp.]